MESQLFWVFLLFLYSVCFIQQLVPGKLACGCRLTFNAQTWGSCLSANSTLSKKANICIIANMLNYLLKAWIFLLHKISSWMFCTQTNRFLKRICPYSYADLGLALKCIPVTPSAGWDYGLVDLLVNCIWWWPFCCENICSFCTHFCTLD